MKRLQVEARPDFGSKLEAIGLSFHSWDDYWREDVCYRFDSGQIDLLEDRTAKLHEMCIEAARYVIDNNRLGEFGIPELFWPAVKASFRKGEFSLYGRFDLAYDGVSEPKLLEYNADTPTSLLESAVAQWYWLQEKFPDEDQFNSLHERLIDQWKVLGGNSRVIYFTSVRGNEEDWVCTHYLMDTAFQAGFDVRHVYIEDLGWDARQETFVDTEDRPIEKLFKLYPWEYAMAEKFGPLTIGAKTQFIEPMWKSVLSCKAILPVLWELFPNHPNLLPAHFNPGEMKSYAKKPFFSREGANIELFENDQLIAHDTGPYGGGKFIYQELSKLPEFDGKYAVIGSWIVGGEPAGMCLREDSMLVTTNMSNFVPHYFVKENP
jgi:glutathionylspermidine synthase